MKKPKPAPKISDFTECPYCGCDQYFQKRRLLVEQDYNRTFDPNGDPENMNMWETYEIRWEGAWYYCEDCRRKICKA
jgi:hypothetical protein